MQNESQLTRHLSILSNIEPQHLPIKQFISNHQSMNNQRTHPKEEVICYCTGTTQAKIETLLANDVDT